MYIAATPLLKASSRILLKLEGCNPSGSIRDRAVFSMIKKAPSLEKPLLVRDWGPFALSAAWAAKLLQRELTVLLPKDAPTPFRELLQKYPCRISNTDEYDSEYYQILDPLTDPEHPMAYCEGLAEELWQQCSGRIGAIVCGTDNCATLMGCSTGLKIHDPDILAVGAALNQEFYGSHDPLGPADPEFYIPQLCDRLSYITPEQAQSAQEQLSRNFGIPCGIVGGAAFAAAQALEQEVDGPIVAVLPSRYACW